MRVLHAVTYVTPDNVFGGPPRVAVDLSHELIRRGHHVELFAPVSGPLVGTAAWQGVPARFFRTRVISRALGFSGITTPSGVRWLARNVGNYDLVHLHLARDLSTMPAGLLARLRGVPYVIQTHGMIDRSDKALAGPIDIVGTRPLFRSARAVLYLTDHERRELEIVSRGRIAPLVHLRNGIPQSSHRADPQHSREFLFVSRLDERKRADYFVRMAVELLNRGVDATFTIVGADQGQGDLVRRLIRDNGVADQVKYLGTVPPDQVETLLTRGRALVLPSVDEPYPMIILEAMAVGLPIICTTSCGLAKAVAANDAGIVVDTDLPSLVAAADALARDDALVQRLSAGASAAAAGPLGIGEVVDRLLEVYQRAVAGSGAGSGAVG